MVTRDRAEGMNRKKDKRPRFRQAVEDFMRDHEIDGYSQMAGDFVRAGYTGKMYSEKIRGWVSHNDGVSEDFFLWLNRAYNPTLQEQQALMEAFRRDAFSFNPKRHS